MVARILTASSGVILLLLVACAVQGPTDVLGHPWLRAQITGSLQEAFAGSGWFRRGGDPRSGGTAEFTVTAQEATHGSRNSLLIWRRMEGIPSPGTYTMALPDEASERWDHFAATYAREVDGVHEAYVARDGHVTIQSVGPQRIEGAFHFTGARYCVRTNDPAVRDAYPCTPARIDPNAPTIEVDGSFAVEPDTFRIVAEPARR